MRPGLLVVAAQAGPLSGPVLWVCIDGAPAVAASSGDCGRLPALGLTSCPPILPTWTPSSQGFVSWFVPWRGTAPQE